MRQFLSLFCFLLLTIMANAQLNFDYQKGKLMIKGKVLDLQTKTPIPLANIRINQTNRGYTTDNEGNFTFYIYPTDTLRFTCTGYLPKSIRIADIDSSGYYTMEVLLFRDFVKLKDVTIYPFKTKEEFADAFIDARDKNKIIIPGIAPPKYSNVTPKAKFTNPVSFLYDRLRRKRSVANPDFKP